MRLVEARLHRTEEALLVFLMWLAFFISSTLQHTLLVKKSAECNYSSFHLLCVTPPPLWLDCVQAVEVRKHKLLFFLRLISKQYGHYICIWEWEEDSRYCFFAAWMHTHMPFCICVCSCKKAPQHTACSKVNLAAFRPSLYYFFVCLCCCWVVRVDTNALSCWYTQPDPAKTPPVTVATIKHCYNWFTALFCLSVWRERFRLASLCQRVIKPASLAAGAVKEWMLGLIFKNQPKIIK